MGRTTGVSKGVSRSLDHIAHIVVVLRSSYNTRRDGIRSPLQHIYRCFSGFRV